MHAVQGNNPADSGRGRAMKQIILSPENNYAELDDFFESNRTKKILLVCGNSLSLLKISGYFDSLEARKGICVFKFSDFSPNPVYESVVRGEEFFAEKKCDTIVAAGGGSAMDVAKCIKFRSKSSAKILAVPTTAGTGSESTKFAVIYLNGEKKSVADSSIIPDAILFDPDFLSTLPVFQKKVTVLDAFCHAIESFWSVNSTDESKNFSRNAIQLILHNADEFFRGKNECNEKMMKAANLAGKAIDIAQTTAGHAMSYVLTGVFGIPHGLAAAICVSKVWRYMIFNPEKCADVRGEKYLQKTFDEIAESMGCPSAESALKKFDAFLDGLNCSADFSSCVFDLEKFASSVNQERLKNNPVKLDFCALKEIYAQILGK
jgi:alcohol dehydrogenase class IV